MMEACKHIIIEDEMWMCYDGYDVLWADWTGLTNPPSVMEYAMCVWFDRLDMCSQSNCMGCKRMDKPASLV